MAEINTNSKQKDKSVNRSKRLSTRVDLTPMVDLGFLLITFFIFTSALAKPTAIKLNLPNDNNVVDSLKISEEKLITLLVSKENRLFYYYGVFGGSVVETSFTEIREVIAAKKRFCFRKFRSYDMTILIKVTDQASYKNVVDCLDEMTINGVSTFMLLDPTYPELAALQH